MSESKKPPAFSWRALTLAGALAIIWLVFLAATGGTFVSPRNLALLARQMSVTSLLAVGMVLVIVTGEIDLSVGAMSGLLGGIAAITLFDNPHVQVKSVSATNVPGGFRVSAGATVN